MIRSCLAVSANALLPILLAASALAADGPARDKTAPTLTLRDDSLRNWQYELDDFDEPNTAAAEPVSQPFTDTTSGAATFDAAVPATAAIVAPEVE